MTPGDGGSRGRFVAWEVRCDVCVRDGVSRWRRAGGRLGSGRGCAKEAAMLEGHGEAWRRRSCRRLDEGRDVGSRRTKRGDECREGGCSDGGSRCGLVTYVVVKDRNGRRGNECRDGGSRRSRAMRGVACRCGGGALHGGAGRGAGRLAKASHPLRG